MYYLNINHYLKYFAQAWMLSSLFISVVIANPEFQSEVEIKAPASLILGPAIPQSYLSEPLLCHISVQGAIEDSQIELGDEEAYHRLKLVRPSILQHVQIQLASEQGQTKLILSSTEDIHEPVMPLVVKVSTSTGHFYKLYRLLLDLKQAKPHVIRSSSLPTKMLAPNHPGSVSKLPHHVVQYADTLWKIAGGLKRPHHTNLKQAVASLYQLNRHAFKYDNINGLQAGTKLVLPSKQDIQSISKADAERIIQQHLQAWPSQAQSSLILEQQPTERVLVEVVLSERCSIPDEVWGQIERLRWMQDIWIYAEQHRSSAKSIVFTQAKLDRSMETLLNEWSQGQITDPASKSIRPSHTTSQAFAWLEESSQETPGLSVDQWLQRSVASISDDYLATTPISMTSKVPAVSSSDRSMIWGWLLMILSLMALVAWWWNQRFQRLAPEHIKAYPRQLDRLLERMHHQRHHKDLLHLLRHELKHHANSQGFTSYLWALCHKLGLKNQINHAVTSAFEQTLSQNWQQQDELSELVAVDDNSLAAQLNLATTYVNMGQYDLARPLLENVMSEGCPNERGDAQSLLDHIQGSANPS